jgi:hypothetical protein
MVNSMPGSMGETAGLSKDELEGQGESAFPLSFLFAKAEAFH